MTYPTLWSKKKMEILGYTDEYQGYYYNVLRNTYYSRFIWETVSRPE